MRASCRFTTTVLLAAFAMLAPLQAEAATYAQRPQSAGMSGKFGVMAADLGSMPGLGVSYWLSDKVALDGVLGVATGSPYTGGTDSAGKPVNDAVSQFALAVAGRYTLAQPVRPLHVQALARIEVGTRGSSTQVLGVSRTNNAFSVGALLGVGLELFLLGGDNLSVQVDSGLAVNSTSSSSNAPGATAINDLSITLGQGGRWLPMNVAVHYYF